MKKLFTGLMMAWGCFTVIPCPKKIWDEEARGYMLLTLPLIGLLVGFVWWGAYLLLWEVLAVPRMLAAVILAFLPAGLTGCIHVDGYMDCCDAIYSRRPLEEKLRILKDSNVGAFACIGLVAIAMLAVAAMDGALSTAQADGHAMLNLIAIPMVSRYASTMNIWTSEPIGTSQYTVISKKEKAGENRKLATASCIMTIILILAFYLICDFNTLTSLLTRFELVLIVELAAHIISCGLAKKQLGGMSGDISGYAICISETAAMLTLALI